MASLMAADAVAGPAYFRVVAVDYDGTLADGQVKPDTLAALAEARARQIRVILVTGRILSELRAVFPDALKQVDAVVAENGAVLALGSPYPDSTVVDLTAAVALTIGTRATSHLRHEHKYDQAGVEPAHRFQFRTEPGPPTGAAAEGGLTRRSPGAVVEQVRLALIRALQDRRAR